MAVSIEQLDLQPIVVEEKPVIQKPAPRHISHTQVSMFDECSLKWWLRYVCKIKKPQTIQILTGDIFHKVMAENFRQKAITGCDLELDEMLDTFATKFDAQVLERSVDIPVGKTIGEFKDAGIATFTNYIRNVAGPLLPKMVHLEGMEEPGPAVEIELLKQIPETEVFFKGVLDLWEDSGKVIDYKVIGKKWGKAQITKGRMQALAYGFLLGGVHPFAFHTCIRDADKPAMFEIDVPINEGEIIGYIHHCWDVIAHMGAVRSGDEEPRVSDGFCNDKLCSYCLSECKDWKFGVFDAEAARATASEGVEGEFVEEEDY